MLSSFYSSKAWVSLYTLLRSERVNSEGYVICAHCGKPIVKKYDCIAHHTIPLTEENYKDANISLNPDLIVLLHHKCHNIIHDKLGYSGRQVYIVYGSPLSGKSSYVRDVAEAGDLIVDIDNIWECVSGCDRYIKPNRLKSVVFSVRDNLLESVKYRRGKWLNAYIIGGYPYQAERERLADTLGARLIHIDTEREECLKRLYVSGDRDVNEWTEYINDYWAKYTGSY